MLASLPKLADDVSWSDETNSKTRGLAYHVSREYCDPNCDLNVGMPFVAVARLNHIRCETDQPFGLRNPTD
jgi:hypothetical protein